MKLSRRNFLEHGVGSVTVIGFSLLKLPPVQRAATAASPEKLAEVPVLWMATGACSGCSVALLNSASPTIAELLLGTVLPGKHVSLGFHSTVMAAAGELAMDALAELVAENKGRFLLVVDGATATKDDGRYCIVGERNGKPITGYAQVRDLGRDAQAVLAVGACAAYGGIPAAEPNPTGCVSVQEIFRREGIETPVVNVAGCPPHPDWIVGTIATLLIGGLQALKLDEHGRPSAFFAPLIHDHCPFRGHYESGRFAERFGEHGCLIKLGCKGPITHADCPIRKFNDGTNWCVEAGHPCIGCCEPDFPFEKSLFAPVEPAQLTFPGTYPPIAEDDRRRADTRTYTTVGLMGVGGFLAGVGVASAARRLKSEARTDRDPGAGLTPVQEQVDDTAE